MSYYTGNITNTETTVGILPGPYYWWEAGAMWGAMLDYYHYTVGVGGETPFLFQIVS
jgi:mannan endo-1,6-alpha-mannosidase